MTNISFINSGISRRLTRFTMKFKSIFPYFRGRAVDVVKVREIREIIQNAKIQSKKIRSKNSFFDSSRANNHWAEAANKIVDLAFKNNQEGKKINKTIRTIVDLTLNLKVSDTERSVFNEKLLAARNDFISKEPEKSTNSVSISGSVSSEKPSSLPSNSSVESEWIKTTDLAWEREKQFSLGLPESFESYMENYDKEAENFFVNQMEKILSALDSSSEMYKTYKQSLDHILPKEDCSDQPRIHEIYKKYREAITDYNQAQIYYDRIKNKFADKTWNEMTQDERNNFQKVAKFAKYLKDELEQSEGEYNLATAEAKKNHVYENKQQYQYMLELAKKLEKQGLMHFV